MTNNRLGVFHRLIIPCLVLIAFAGCGYKAPPKYTADSTIEMVSQG